MADTDFIPEDILDLAVEFALREVYLGELEAATPKKTGATSKSWKLRREGSMDYVIFNDKLTGPNGIPIVELLEFGTRPHEIKAKNKRALHWQKGTKDFFAKRVKHPGFAARMFVQRTLEREDLFKRYQDFVEIRVKQLAGF